MKSMTNTTNMKSGLLTVDEVPDVLKEPYVVTGYRPPNRKWRYYLMSIFHLHNETVNVWSHLIPCFYVLYLLRTYSDEVDFTSDVSTSLMLLLGISNVTVHFLSANAHLLYSRSSAAYYVAFIFDYVGIAFHTANVGTAQFFISSEPSFYSVLHPWFPWACVLVSSCYLAAMAYTHVRYRTTDPERSVIQLYSFGIMYLWAMSPIIHRIFSDFYTGSMDDITWMHIRHILLVPIAGFFLSSGVPQKFHPGMCDVIGHGHQIFHVIISASLLTQQEAVFADLRNRRHLELDRPSDLSITTYCVVLLTSYAYIVDIFVRRALSKAKM